MDAEETVTVDTTCRHDEGNSVASRKDTWDSLPREIKEKIIKHAPLKTRLAVKRVSKEWIDIVTVLNQNQTKLIVLGRCESAKDSMSIPDANMLCNLAGHSFDNTQILRLQVILKKKDRQRLVKNFPNLLAVEVADSASRDCATQTRRGSILVDFARMCRNLEHLSYPEKVSTELNLGFIGEKWTCLQIPNSVLMETSYLANLKYFNDRVIDNDRFAGMLERGLVGYSHRQLNPMTMTLPNVLRAETLYDVYFDGTDTTEIIGRLSQMPNLNTVHGDGDVTSLASLGQLTGLTKLCWTDYRRAEDDNGGDLYDALVPWGHRLRSLCLEVLYLDGEVIRAVVASCPNLEELHFEELTEGDEDLPARNAIHEFELLQLLPNLKTLSVDDEDIDLKFLRMFDPEIPEIQAMRDLGIQMTIEQLINVQHEIKKGKSAVQDAHRAELEAKDKRIQELEAQIAKFQQANP